MNQEVKELKSQLTALKKEMKAKNIRKISCFNGGLTSDEARYNSQLFILKSAIAKAEHA